MDSQQLQTRIESMPSEGSPRELVEQENVRRTWGQVHRLRVDVLRGCVIVSGCTPTYHAKQLVLAAVLGALDSTNTRYEIDIDIAVGPHAR